MEKQDLRIVYMGTPDFAVEPLRKLVEGGYNVVGVITMLDKPIGRHQTELSASPVKQYAVEHGLKVLQPAKLKDPDFIEELRSLQADLQIVVAFRMLPEVVWAMPRLGTFNLHAALLPQYRGAAPINWAIINGDTQTGITTFFLDHDIDTGSVIQRVPVPILDTDNAEDVHDKLMYLGSDLVVETVDNILADRVHPIPQEELVSDEPLRPAPKIFKETCRIDWSLGVKRTYDFIRGLSPYPAAWTELLVNGKKSVLKVYATTKEFTTSSESVGTVLTDGKTYLKVALADGYLHLQTLQLAGKKRMEVADFLRGFHATEGLCVE
ncbi:MAG: methionyl-tRNA formyltransferase [Prevotellamassilia sp.]